MLVNGMVDEERAKEGRQTRKELGKVEKEWWRSKKLTIF
jgi:hypothetical protein